MAIQNVALFVKVIARMRFDKESSLLRKSQFFIHSPVTLTPTLTSTGYFGAPCMVYNVVPTIGMTKINAILWSIGLTPLLKDHCLFSGFIQDPLDPSGAKSKSLLSLGLYVNDFMYFLKDLAAKALICCLLAKRCKVDFMGIMNWFLEDYFSWWITFLADTVHLNQSGFASNLVKVSPSLTDPKLLQQPHTAWVFQ
jgi:hypothetical protein